LTPNVLALQIQPDEGISCNSAPSGPAPTIHLGAVRMDFRYRDYFNTDPSTGYETLVYDCMIGDPILFQRADSVEASWAVVQRCSICGIRTRACRSNSTRRAPPGPDAAEQLLWRSGRSGVRSR